MDWLACIYAAICDWLDDRRTYRQHLRDVRDHNWRLSRDAADQHYYGYRKLPPLLPADEGDGKVLVLHGADPFSSVFTDDIVELRRQLRAHAGTPIRMPRRK